MFIYVAAGRITQPGGQHFGHACPMLSDWNIQYLDFPECIVRFQVVLMFWVMTPCSLVCAGMFSAWSKVQTYGRRSLKTLHGGITENTTTQFWPPWTPGVSHYFSCILQLWTFEVGYRTVSLSCCRPHAYFFSVNVGLWCDIFNCIWVDPRWQ